MDSIPEILNISKQNIYYNESMKKHTSFKIGGEAECLIKIKNEMELKKILEYAKSKKIPLTIIGNGSNLLVLDSGIKGIVLKMDMDNIKIEEAEDGVIVTAESGCKLGMVAQLMLKKEITGMEELSGIPGTIGGAIRMNAGAHGKEMKDIVESVICMDYEGNIVEFSKEQMDFKYRESILKTEKYIVISVKLKLKKGNCEQIKEQMKEYANYRKEKQPIEYPSAGSTFKRGDDFITAKLIDEAGLKGYTIGGAMISTKHSGFIINKGNATAKDVLDLVKYVQEEIEKKFSKKIELEIQVVGEKE